MNFGGKLPKVLFFFKDAVASEEEKEAVSEISGVNLQLRNGAAVEGSLEAADFVAGNVPEAYARYETYTAAKAKAFVKRSDKAAQAEQEARPVPGQTGGGPATESPVTPSPLAGGSAEAAAGIVPAPTGSETPAQTATPGGATAQGTSPTPPKPAKPVAWGKQ